MKRIERLNIQRILRAEKGSQYRISKQLGVTSAAIAGVLMGRSKSQRVEAVLRCAAQDLAPGVDLTKPMVRAHAEREKSHV